MTTTSFELRDQGDGTVAFEGYASVTEVAYDFGAGYIETVKRNAFKRTLGETPDVVLLVEHAGLPLARTKSGTLQLVEDRIGLKATAQLDAHDPEVQSIKRKYERGDLNGEMSFAFRVSDQSWNADYSERTIKSVVLHRGDVSIVSRGANPQTVSSVRGDAFTLEERAKRAEQLGDRFCGGNGGIVTLGESVAVARRVLPDFTTAARAEFERMLARDGQSLEQWRRGRGRGSSDFLAQARADLDRALAEARRRP